METVWLPPARRAENAEYIFAGDIGGTNTSLALTEIFQGGPRLIGKFLFKTKELSSVVQAAAEAKAEIQKTFPGLRIRKACFSVAGIVGENNTCAMTNVPWTVSGGGLENALGFPVKIINDFSAISYALPLLDPENPLELTRLAAPECPPARPRGGIRAVAGAGTGLGVGCLIETAAGLEAIGSEGGHIDFAAFDEESRGLCDWMTRRVGAIPETELFVSGQGLANAFDYFYEKNREAGSLSPKFAEIAAASGADKPGLLARNAASDAGCAAIMRLFVRMYARFAAGIALTFIPQAGLFLAGGIAAKNESWFTDGGAFMQSFLLVCKPKIRELLQTIPVYIIKDYGVSLLGAANAARYLMKDA